MGESVGARSIRENKEEKEEEEEGVQIKLSAPTVCQCTGHQTAVQAHSIKFCNTYRVCFECWKMPY